MTRFLGNHDITLDSKFYKDHGLDFHNQNPQEPQACIDLIQQYPSIVYLNHESTQVYLKREGGPGTSFKVFGSPFSPASGVWGFGYPPEHASLLWDQIPLNTDIVITHTPPKYHCDESKHVKALGCKALRETLWRVRPSLAICGHVHEGRGAERILWDLDCPNVKFKESATGYWKDPGFGIGNKKQSLLDLSARSPAPLNGTGSWTNQSDELNVDGSAETSANGLLARKSPQSFAWTSATSRLGIFASEVSYAEDPPVLHTPVNRDQDNTLQARRSVSVASEHLASSSEGSYEADRYRDSEKPPKIADDQGQSSTHPSFVSEKLPANQGLGGYPPSGRCDLEALAERRGRKETCVINASIMASNWPYKSKDDRRYNKPIIVDIDLPVWRK